VIQASFGDSCPADTTSGDNSMEPRARGTLALYEAGDYDANGWVFHLDTEKVVKRYKLTVLPVQDIVINYLNRLHNKEYNVDNVEHRRESLLEFRIEQRVLDDTTVLQHSGCIIHYWLFYVTAIYLYCTVHSPTTLLIY